MKVVFKVGPIEEEEYSGEHMDERDLDEDDTDESNDDDESEETDLL